MIVRAVRDTTWHQVACLEPDFVEPKVMLELTRDNMAEHEDHSRVFAFVDAYEDLTDGAMPWTVLTGCMYLARSLDQTELALARGRLIERSLRAILIDLSRLGMISVSSSGSRPTDWGREKVKDWSRYADRRAAAREALEQWGATRSVRGRG